MQSHLPLCSTTLNQGRPIFNRQLKKSKPMRWALRTMAPQTLSKRICLWQSKTWSSCSERTRPSVTEPRKSDWFLTTRMTSFSTRSRSQSSHMSTTFPISKLSARRTWTFSGGKSSRHMNCSNCKSRKNQRDYSKSLKKTSTINKRSPKSNLTTRSSNYRLNLKMKPRRRKASLSNYKEERARPTTCMKVGMARSPSLSRIRSTINWLKNSLSCSCTGRTRTSSRPVLKAKSRRNREPQC